MGFSLGKFLKKALNPLAPFQAMRDTVGAAKRGDWKGALKSSMLGGLPPGTITPETFRDSQSRPQGDSVAFAKGGPEGAPQEFAQGQQEFARAGGPQPSQAFQRMGPMGGGGGMAFSRMGSFRQRRPMGQFGQMGGFRGSFGGGGMDEGLQKIIQEYMSKKNQGGGGGFQGGGGSFSSMGG